MLKKTLLISAFSSLILSSVSYAGKIDVVNENHKALDIKIEAEGDSKAVSKQQVSADHKSSFEVTSAQLNGKSYFSIKGDTSAFRPHAAIRVKNTHRRYSNNLVTIAKSRFLRN